MPDDVLLVSANLSRFVTRQREPYSIITTKVFVSRKTKPMIYERGNIRIRRRIRGGDFI